MIDVRVGKRRFDLGLRDRVGEVAGPCGVTAGDVAGLGLDFAFYDDDVVARICDGRSGVTAGVPAPTTTTSKVTVRAVADAPSAFRPDGERQRIRRVKSTRISDGLLEQSSRDERPTAGDGTSIRICSGRSGAAAATSAWSLQSSSMTEHTVTFVGTGESIQVTDKQTILKACIEEGIAQEYSCRVGMCLACSAEILEGDVVQPAARGLTEERENYALTCMARSHSPERERAERGCLRSDGCQSRRIGQALRSGDRERKEGEKTEKTGFPVIPGFLRRCSITARYRAVKPRMKDRSYKQVAPIE